MSNSRATRLTKRLAELRPFIGATILHLESKTRFRITHLHIRAADGEPCFTYEPVSQAECDRIPMSRPVKEIIGDPRFEFIAGDYRPHKPRTQWQPRHVLKL